MRRGGWLGILGVLLLLGWARAAEMPRGFAQVAQDDAGDAKAQPHLTQGTAYTLTAEEQAAGVMGDRRYLTLAVHPTAVVFRYLGVRPDAQYALRVHYYNVTHARTQRLLVDGRELTPARELPLGKPLVDTVVIPPDLYKDAVLIVSAEKVAGPSAIVSAIELWSNVPDLLGPVGTFVRFRVDALPPDKDELAISAVMKIHSAPWTTPAFSLTPEPAVEEGYTGWVDLRNQPGGGNGSLILTIPKGAKGATQFGVVEDEDAYVREINWDEPDGTKIIFDPGLTDIRTFRDQERRYYLHALELTGNRLFPLTRPPLRFSNAWGYTTGGAADYMVKSFRLLGFNSVSTSEDAAKYERLYGWGSQQGHYWPPSFLPYDEDGAREKYQTHYEQYFTTGPGKDYSPGMGAFQLADEPQEIDLKVDDAEDGFRAWLVEQGLKPGFFGKGNWEEVYPLFANAKTPEEKRLYYWSRKYRGMLTPKMFALAGEAFRANSPNPDVVPFVALSGHALNFGNKLPLDMFQLAQYPDIMPGISDWMSSGSWWWDSHQSVAFSVAPFNAGARQYTRDGIGYTGFPMMHCVWPSLFRAYTQVANQCKLISYYNYGPDYEVTEGFWSNSDWSRYVTCRIDNQAGQVDDILSPGVMRHSRVAMLYSMSSEYWWPQGFYPDKRAAFLALSHDYYQPELVTEAQIEAGALQHYDALYVLDAYVTEKAQTAIAAWVQRGGLLWASADAASNNEYGEPSDLLARLAGLKRYFGAVPKEALKVSPVPGDIQFDAHDVPPDGRPLRLAWEGARVRATYADGMPAWLEGPVGRGKLVYLGHRAGLSYSRRLTKKGEKAIWPTAGRQFLTQPLMEARFRQEFTLSEPLVMASALSSEGGTVVVLFDTTEQARKDLTLWLREARRPVSVQWFDEQMNLQPLPFDYTDGVVKITLPTLPWYGNMVVVRTRPAPADPRPAQIRKVIDEGLASDDWQELSAAAWFAGFFPQWNYAPELSALLEDEHWAVRRGAAEALGRLGAKNEAQFLRDAVDREEDSHALADEVWALAVLNHKDAPALVQTLRNLQDPFLTREANRIQGVIDAKKAGR